MLRFFFIQIKKHQLITEKENKDVLLNSGITQSLAWFNLNLQNIGYKTCLLSSIDKIRMDMTSKKGKKGYPYLKRKTYMLDTFDRCSWQHSLHSIQHHSILQFDLDPGSFQDNTPAFLLHLHCLVCLVPNSCNSKVFHQSMSTNLGLGPVQLRILQLLFSLKQKQFSKNHLSLHLELKQVDPEI